MLIDTHTHVVPDTFPTNKNNSLWPIMKHSSKGTADVMINNSNFRTISDKAWSVPDRLSEMDKNQVTQQVLSPMPELLSYWFTDNDGDQICDYINDFIASMVTQNPERFIGLGIVPLQNIEMAIRSLKKIKALGLKGVEIGSNINGLSLGDKRFFPFFKELESLDLCVFIHALHPTFAERITTSQNSLPTAINAIGFPTDVGLTAASLITSGLLEKQKDLRILLSHGGGTLPSILPRLNHAWSRTWNELSEDNEGANNLLRENLPNSPLSYGRSFFYDTLVFHKKTIEYLIELLTVDSLTIGTDFPFLKTETPVGKTINSMALQDLDLQKIQMLNAQKWLKV